MEDELGENADLLKLAADLERAKIAAWTSLNVLNGQN